MARRRQKKVLKKVLLCTKVEKKVATYLNDLKIAYKQNASVGKYSVDFLVNEKYIIEAYGDYWHCNPQKYSPDYYNRGLKCEAHERWAKDQKRQEELEALGYQFLVLWEHEINKIPKLCKAKVLQLLSGNYKSPLD